MFFVQMFFSKILLLFFEVYLLPACLFLFSQRFKIYSTSATNTGYRDYEGVFVTLKC